MRSALLGIAAFGAVGVASICDLCTPSAAVAPLRLRSAYAVPAAALAESPQPASARPLPSVAVAGQPKTVRFRVAGMTCGGCAIGTRTVLTRLPGVIKAEVSYEQSEAVVTFDPDKVTVAQMVAAVKTLDYTATPVDP